VYPASLIFVIIASRKNSGDVSVAVTFIGIFRSREDQTHGPRGGVVTANQRDSRFWGNPPTIAENARTTLPEMVQHADLTGNRSGATNRPPGASCFHHWAGMSHGETVTIMRSYGAWSG
jgi:hypothetical protein